MNPCRECLITSMCKKACPELMGYIALKYRPLSSNYHGMKSDHIAACLRYGIYKFDNNIIRRSSDDTPLFRMSAD